MAKTKKSKELSFSSMVINKIKKKKRFNKSIEIASFLNIKPNTLSTYLYRDSVDVKRIIECCQDFDFNWLLRTDSQYNEFISRNPLSVQSECVFSTNSDIEPTEKGDKLSKNRIEELENQVNALILQNSTLIELLHQSMTTKKADK